MSPHKTWLRGTFIGLIGGILCAFVVPPSRALAAPTDDSSPAGVLAAKGLTKSKKDTNVWVTEQEARLGKELEAARNAEAKFKTLRSKLFALLKEVTVKKEKFDIGMKRLREMIVGNQIQPKNAKESQEVQQILPFIKENEAKYAQIALPQEHVDVKKAVVEMSEARNAVALALLKMQPLVAEAEESYAKLAEDAEVTAALGTLKAKLGPSKGMGGDRKLFDTMMGQILGNEVPYAGEGPAKLVSTIVNEKTTVMFRLDNMNAISWISKKAVDALALKLDGAAMRQLMVNDRKINCHAVRIPTIRIGKYVFSDVEMLAMPADADDLGSQLGHNLLDDFAMSFDQDKFVFRIESRNPMPEPNAVAGDPKNKKPMPKPAPKEEPEPSPTPMPAEEPTTPEETPTEEPTAIKPEARFDVKDDFFVDPKKE